MCPAPDCRVLPNVLAETAASRGATIALVAGIRRLTFAALDEASTALAHALVRRGVNRRDRVAVCLDNSIEAMIAFWGILKARAIVVMVHPRTTTDQLAFVLDDCRPSCLITSTGLISALSLAVQAPSITSVLAVGRVPRAAPDEVVSAWEPALALEHRRPASSHSGSADDIAVLFYTSLGTPDAKAVALAHRAVLAGASALTAAHANTDDDVVLGWLPFSFDFGLYQAIAACAGGARLVIEKGFDWPVEVLTRAATEGVTIFPVVPTLLATLADNETLPAFMLHSVRAVTSAGDALVSKYYRRLRRMFPNADVLSTYGLTECRPSTQWRNDLDGGHATSVGRPCSGTVLRIEDAAGRTVGAGTVGELVIESASMMMGYWRRPFETAGAVRRTRAGTLALHTGELCRLDRNGSLHLVGRRDEIVEASDARVAAKEIEQRIRAVEGVKEAAVVVVSAGPTQGTAKAYVTLEHDVTLTLEQLERACRQQLPRSMLPAAFEVWQALPKSHHGKIDRRRLAWLDERVDARSVDAPGAHAVSGEGGHA